jgi:hypothetical protein
MKKLLKLGFVLVILLVVLAACPLFQQINVGWHIDYWGGTSSSSILTVDYTVRNLGKYDLTGVNLKIAAYVPSAGGYIYDWTPDFDLSQNEVDSDSFDIDIFPYHLPDVDWVEVLGVDMDNPRD